MENKDILKQSFIELKRTARSNDDVEAWFTKHPQAFPGVPLQWLQRLSIETQSYIGDNPVGDDFGASITFYLSARVDSDDATSLSESEFTDMTGCGVLENKHHGQSQSYDGVVTMWLTAKEWPYVCASVAHNLLTGSDDAREEEITSTFIAHVYAHSFPHVDWDLLVTLHDSGILPDNEQEFVQWLCDQSYKNENATSSPEMA